MAEAFTRTAKQLALRTLLSGPATHCLAYGGSRSGKTFGFIDAICTRAINAPGSRHGVFRYRFNAVKTSILQDTFPKVMKLAFPGVSVSVNKQDGYAELVTERGKSEIWFGGLDDKERTEKILGMEFATIYTNEASQVPYESYLLLQTRLAQNVPRLDGRPLALKDYVDLNPTTDTHWTNQLWIAGVEPQSKKFIDKSNYAHLHINPVDNLANLPAEYLKNLEALPERQRRRFLDGNYQGDVEGALWRRQIIGRLSEAPKMRRIVVAIDPAVSTKVGSDETGIIVAGVDERGRGIVLEDESGHYSPEEGARRAVGLYRHYQADRIVYEANQGGDWVDAVIKAQAPNVPTAAVRASRGKWIRAEPVAALYERGKVFHVGVFDQLEDQMCFVAGTLVETARGQVPIERVSKGDYVLTRDGYAPVKTARQTGISKQLVVISTGNSKLECTPCHPVFLPTTGEFVNAGSVCPSDYLLESRNWANSECRLLGAGDGITAWRAGISAMQRESSFTAESMRSMLARYLRGYTSTTRTAIQETIDWIIWNAYLHPTTSLSMSRAAGGLLQLQSHARQPQSGNGRSADLVHSRALSAERPAKPRPRKAASTVLSAVSSVRSIDARVPVYNVEVTSPGLPEYFANGVLVHNCALTPDFDRGREGYSPDRVDALVWAMTDLFPDVVSVTPSKFNRDLNYGNLGLA